MTSYLIVNSDDFGISAEVSRGIMQAQREGIVTSTSAMVNCPACPQALADAHRDTPNLGIGLHFVLSYSKPVSAPEKVPSLLVDGVHFPQTYQGLMERLPHYQADELELELRAQFDRFVALTGHLPDHLDSHHNSTYMHPVAFRVMAELAQQHGLPIRAVPWAYGDEQSHVSTNTDGKLNATLQAIAQRYTLRSPQFVMDGTFFWDRRPRLESLRTVLSTLKDGYTELICHVGYGANLPEDYNIQREDELEAILHPSIAQFLAERGVQRIRFSDLPA